MEEHDLQQHGQGEQDQLTGQISRGQIVDHRFRSQETSPPILTGLIIRETAKKRKPIMCLKIFSFLLQCVVSK